MAPEKVTHDPETSATAANVVSVSHGSQLKTATGSSQSSRSSRSSLRIAKAIAKQEVARLHIHQLQEQRLLEEKEFELEHQREVLKASHQLQKAAVERQVFEEELERGGYSF